MRRLQQRQASDSNSKRNTDDEIWGELSGSSDGEEEEDDASTMVGRGEGGRELQRRAKAFDDVLWQEGNNKGAARPRRGETTPSSKTRGTNAAQVVEDETYTKLIAFSEAVKKISILVRVRSLPSHCAPPNLEPSIFNCFYFIFNTN
jgi:hypothetical protein